MIPEGGKKYLKENEIGDLYIGGGENEYFRATEIEIFGLK